MSVLHRQLIALLVSSENHLIDYIHVDHLIIDFMSYRFMATFSVYANRKNDVIEHVY